MIRSTISRLRALRDVNPAGLANGDTIRWDAATSKFVPGAGGTANAILPAGWDSRYVAAKEAGTAQISVIGDSISRGYFSSGLDTTGWVALVRTALQAEVGNGGSGFKGVGDTALISGGSTTGYAEELVVTGTWNDGNAAEGPGGHFLNGSDSSPGTITFHVNGTSVDVYYLTLAGGGHLGVTIDGAVKTAINTAGSNGVAKTTYTVAAGAHTVLITNAGDSGKYVNVCGVSGRNATGLRVENFSSTGRTTVDFTKYDGAGDPRTYGSPALWSGGSSYATSTNLFIYSLCINDAVAGVDPVAAIHQRVRDWVKEAREGAVQPDMLFVLQHVGSVDAGDSNYKSGYYAEYASMIQDYAQIYNAGFLNVWGVGRNSWDYWNGLGYWGVDHTGVTGTNSVHPSDLGHAAIADLALNLL